MTVLRWRSTASILPLLALFGATAVLMFGARPAAGADWHDRACVGDSGVTVVVDATDTGGAITVRCALGPQESGWEVLTNAGFTVAANPNFAGAVCQIDGRPSAGFPTCWETNFWSYHRAPNARAGAAWTFSGGGATTSKPALGSVEGWKYTSTATQRAAPGAGPVFPEAVPPTTTPTTSPPAAPTTPPPSNGGTTPPGAGPAAVIPPTVAPKPGGATTTTIVGGAGVTSPSTPLPAVGAETGSTPTSTVSPGSSPADAEPLEGRALDGVDLSSETRPSNGFPYGVVAGGALILALATSAGVVAYRRRPAPSPPG